ncbi:uncharacterized protein LOC106755508 [Vigna radiata var. radiata]|uniref:Uncharacterized protein LOC106755508 n=1 Tax=Vigna radiata var. radiata TaxID=3916 RepID=A0A1S3THB3_VIGRR|nr:uncharacterized protein LOC106755508 [Vigna radiata var. radiata]
MEHKAWWKRGNQLLELEELRLHAYESFRTYKDKVKFYHVKKLMKRTFHPGDLVLLFNSWLKLFPGKLKSKWSGPFMVKRVFQSGAVELESSIEDDQQRRWIVNGQRLKHYVGGDVEQLASVMMLVDP